MTKCPQCGYTENVQVKLQSNVMNRYVVDATDEVYGVLNSEEEYISIAANPKAGVNAVKLRRADVKKPAATPATPPTKK